MAIVAWPSGVNQNVYGMEASPKENVERIEFESGKARTYLKNSAQKKVFSFMLTLNDVGAESEYKTFTEWWDEVLLSGANSFYMTDLITHTGNTEYRAISGYSATGQREKEISLTVEEM